MSLIKNIEKIPEEVRDLTEKGLLSALERGNLGKMKINFIQIENSLSGGKTGAVVFVARYGHDGSDSPISKKKPTKPKSKKKNSTETEEPENSEEKVSIGTTYVRVLKIAPKEVCESENEGNVKTREMLLDIFSQVEYYPEDEFVYDPTISSTKGELYRKDLINQVLTIKDSTIEDDGDSKSYGILLYQDVGTVAAGDLKGIAKYFTRRILKEDNENKPELKIETEKFARELSLLMEKEVFLGLKKALYGVVKRKDVNLSEYYGVKLTSDKVKQGLAELKKIDSSLPDHSIILEYFQIRSTYHEVNYIHGDLNPENVLVWENERGFLSCKLIDFGEVMPKKKDNFTPLFWDYSRLLGEMILNFVEELMNQPNVGDGCDRPLHSVDSILSDFWSVVEAFFKNDSSKLENADPKIEYISRIYLSTLFDFINEAKSGLKDLRRAEVIQDYFYCQILFFIFFAKFERENPYKRLFGVKFALKLYEYAKSGDAGLQSLILSLEKFYFDFSSGQSKNKEPQIGPLAGAKSPFMGLSYFKEEDREFFFGREKFTEELLKAIEERPIVALAGSSGSGKSSVVHAGVIPKLREQGYLIYKFRPGVNPYLAAVNSLKSPLPPFAKGGVVQGDFVGKLDLKELIGSILKSNPDKRLFLLGDQFEEMFTLCTDARQREDLGQALIDAAKEFKDRFRFFITIRSDFWTKLLEDAGFASVVGNSGDYKDLGERFFLSAMNTEELRSTIEKPLAVSKLFIQDGLTDLILTSISREPGSLPLLEFCLHELWKKQVDFTLNYNSYKEIGEVKGALATYADQVYSELSEDEREQLKKIMLQLVQPGQGTEDTRRIALVEEVVVGASRYTAGAAGSTRRPYSSVEDNSSNNEEAKKSGRRVISNTSGENSANEKIGNRMDSTSSPQVEMPTTNTDFINTLADKRLIVTGINETGKQTLEVVHEALIREWKRLKEWINADREFRVWQEKLRYAEKEWDTGKKDQNLLLRGSNLLTAIDWYVTRKNDLGRRETEYIETSKARATRTKVILWSAGIIVSTLILGFGVFGTVMFFKAETSKKEAMAAKDEADKKNNEAIEANKLAKENQEEADKHKIEAEEQEKKATAKEKEALKLQEENKKKEADLKVLEQKAKDETEKALKAKNEAEEAVIKMEGSYKEAADITRWSEYQGSLKWEDAKQKCASLGEGWRLPKRGEWSVVYKANPEKMKEWAEEAKKKDGYTYFWTAEESSEVYAYYFDVDYGYVFSLNIYNDRPVRCIR